MHALRAAGKRPVPACRGLVAGEHVLQRLERALQRLVVDLFLVGFRARGIRGRAVRWCIRRPRGSICGSGSDASRRHIPRTRGSIRRSGFDAAHVARGLGTVGGPLLAHGLRFRPRLRVRFLVQAGPVRDPALQDLELLQLTLQQRAVAPCELRLACAQSLQRLFLALDLLCNVRADLLGLLLRLAARQLRIAQGLLPHFLAELLRTHERVGQRTLALLVIAKLLFELPDAVLVTEVLAHELLQSISHQLEEVVDQRGVVAAHCALEVAFLLADFERCQIDHRSRSPKRTVPSRTIVAPSSTAHSKSFDIPIDRCSARNPSTSRAHSSKRARVPWKVRRTTTSSSVNGAIVMRPSTRRPGRAQISATGPVPFATSKPPFVSSPDAFTCTRTSTVRSALTASAETTFARRSESSECSRSK